MAESSDGVHRYHHDWSESTSISTTVITGLSEVLDTSVDDLSSLSEVAPLDSFDDVLRPAAPDGSPRRSDLRLMFEYESYRVTVYRNGEVRIQSSEDVD